MPGIPDVIHIVLSNRLEAGIVSIPGDRDRRACLRQISRREPSVQADQQHIRIFGFKLGGARQ